MLKVTANCPKGLEFCQQFENKSDTFFGKFTPSLWREHDCLGWRHSADYFDPMLQCSTHENCWSVNTDLHLSINSVRILSMQLKHHRDVSRNLSKYNESLPVQVNDLTN